MNATATQAQTVPVGAEGIFATQPREHDYVVDELDGDLPAGLRGTLYRVGCGKFESGGQPLGHIYDGDGLVSMFVLTGDGVQFRSRYVRTPDYQAGRRGKGVPSRRIGTNRRGGWLGNVLRTPANLPNTHVVLHHRDLYTMGGVGRPYRLDPSTLDTLGEHDFGGRLSQLTSFSAHVKVDPTTGDLWNFGLDLLPRPTLRCYRVDRHGRLDTVRQVHVPDMVLLHDFALTERHMVFVLQPAVLDRLHVLRFLLLGERLADVVRWRPDRGMTLLLVPRNGTEPRIAQTDAFFYFHVNNAYEDGSDTVLDIVRWSHGWDDVLPHFDRFRTTHGGAVTTTLTRLRITPDGRVHAEDLWDRACEFPQHDWRCTGRRYRFSYVTTGTNPDLSGVANATSHAHVISKIDHHTGEVRSHALPADHRVGEPIFVARHERAAEDDGWLLAVAYNPAEHRSRLLVLDARDPQRDPALVAHLGHHIPFGFHGSFTRRVARAEWR